MEQHVGLFRSGAAADCDQPPVGPQRGRRIRGGVRDASRDAACEASDEICALPARIARSGLSAGRKEICGLSAGHEVFESVSGAVSALLNVQRIGTSSQERSCSEQFPFQCPHHKDGEVQSCHDLTAENRGPTLAVGLRNLGPSLARDIDINAPGWEKKLTWKSVKAGIRQGRKNPALSCLTDEELRLWMADYTILLV